MKVAYESVEVPDRMQTGATATAVVKVTNTSDQTWPAAVSPDKRVFIALSYHWLYADRKKVAHGARTRLKEDLKPGESVTLEVSVQAPEEPGAYQLEFDMVQEGVAWFSWEGADVLTVPVVVE